MPGLGRGAGPVVWLAVAKEVNPPAGVEAVYWRVWTTAEIGSGRKVEEVNGWYPNRFGMARVGPMAGAPLLDR